MQSAELQTFVICQNLNIHMHLLHHFQFTSQESKMIATPARVEKVQKCAFNFEIYRFLKKAANLPHPPLPFTI